MRTVEAVDREYVLLKKKVIILSEWNNSVLKQSVE